MGFNVVELDDGGAARAAGSGISSAGDSIVAAMNSVQSSWSPIGGQYFAPEAGQVINAMTAPSTLSRQLDAATMSVKSALDAYGAELDALNRDRDRILAKIAVYNAMNPPPDDLEGQREKERLRQEIEADCARLAENKDRAQNQCRGALLGITVGGHTASNAAGIDLAKADEAGGNMVGSFFKALWDRVARNNSYGGAVGPLMQIGLLTMDKWKYAIQYTQLSKYWTTVNLDAAAKGLWKAPKTLEKFADSSWTAMILVHKATGWTPMGASWNPMAKPSGFKESVKAVGGRTLMQLNTSENRIPVNPAYQSHLDTIGKVSKNLGHVGTAVGVATTSVSSWQADSKAYPAMGGVEKGARAATMAATSTAGGIAGTKAGAAVGAAAGSLLGPGGALAGAVIGGIVGGVGGGKVGSWAGDKAKDTVGDGAAFIWDKVAN